MILELINTLLLSFLEEFQEIFEDLNSDLYPEDYVIIEHKNGKKELIKFEI